MSSSETSWDVIVVGGGAAGLSAALVLGRARRRTLVVDVGAPSNLAAHGIGGLLGQDGRPPAELYARGREELAAYPSVEVRAGEVVGGEADASGARLTLADGARLDARHVLLATGMDYRPPALPGLAERFGRSVFHCPFCHGWEVRDRALGVLDASPAGAQRALLLRAWSDDVTLYGRPSEEDVARLRAAGVAIESRSVVGVDGPGEGLRAVLLEDGAERACGGLLVATTLHQRSDLARRLGVELAEPGPVAADAVLAQPTGRTSVPSVWAAGDVATSMPQVAAAVAGGSVAAAMIVHELLVGTSAPSPGSGAAGSSAGPVAPSVPEGGPPVGAVAASGGPVAASAGGAA